MVAEEVPYSVPRPHPVTIIWQLSSDKNAFVGALGFLQTIYLIRIDIKIYKELIKLNSKN